jgi:hypothetical protein
MHDGGNITWLITNFSGYKLWTVNCQAEKQLIFKREPRPPNSSQASWEIKQKTFTLCSFYMKFLHHCFPWSQVVNINSSPFSFLSWMICILCWTLFRIIHVLLTFYFLILLFYRALVCFSQFNKTKFVLSSYSKSKGVGRGRGRNDPSLVCTYE